MYMYMNASGVARGAHTSVREQEVVEACNIENIYIGVKPMRRLVQQPLQR